MSKKRKCWSSSVGVYGSRVRVSERRPGGLLYLLWVARDRRQHKRSLGHSDRKTGKEQALVLASQLAENRDAAERVELTLSTLFDIYESEGLHGRGETHRREVGRKLALWSEFLGQERRVDTLSPADVERFVSARKEQRLHPPGRRSVQGPGMTTIAHDYTALTTALNFAVRHRDQNGRRLLQSNPLVGVRVSKTTSPSRPVADHVLYGALRGVANQLNTKFLLALVLANETGHRIDAILKLRWSDITLVRTDEAPFGTVRWRGENDKIENEHTLPMNEHAWEALTAATHMQHAIGEAWVFPSDTDSSKPVDRHLASRWLRRAEGLAGITHVKGRGWHAFRRGWASSRKHWPDVDVAAAGGWKDTATMKRCYQHADEVTVLRVVLEPSKRRLG